MKLVRLHVLRGLPTSRLPRKRLEVLGSVCALCVCCSGQMPACKSRPLSGSEGGLLKCSLIKSRSASPAVLPRFLRSLVLAERKSSARTRFRRLALPAIFVVSLHVV